MSEDRAEIQTKSTETKTNGGWLTDKDIKTRLIGDVPKDTEREVVSTVLDVFKKMNFKGPAPEIVSLSQGAVILPSGEEIEASYSYVKPKVPGRIYVSTEKSKTAFGDSNIPIGVATAAFAAHEAVEHVNHMRGRKLLSSPRKLSPEKHKSDTEDEANSIAREVIKERSGWTVYFGDETSP